MSFLTTHSLSAAFLGYRSGRLLEILSDQGDIYLKNAGLSFPARANLTILLIDERENFSIADITNELKQPHQLVAQRVTLLIERGLVKKIADPQDGRRNILKLTKKGKKEVAILRDCLAGAISAFEKLFDDMGVDLNAVMEKAIAAFLEVPIEDRVNIACTETRIVNAKR